MISCTDTFWQIGDAVIHISYIWRSVSALNSNDIWAVMELRLQTAYEHRHRNTLHVINIKGTLWSMLGLIGSVTRTAELSCQILLNSCLAALSLTGSSFLFLYIYLYYTCLLGSIWTLFQLPGCQLWFLFFLCTSYWVFLLNSLFHHWSMFYHCFILTIGQLPNRLFPLTVDPWGLQCVKKPWNAAHNLHLLDPVCLLSAPCIYRSVSAGGGCTVK